MAKRRINDKYFSFYCVRINVYAFDLELFKNFYFFCYAKIGYNKLRLKCNKIRNNDLERLLRNFIFTALCMVL